MSEKKEYIERGALVDALEKYKSELSWDVAQIHIGSAIAMVIKHHAADVEPVVRGEWIVKGNNPIDGTCSVCGARGNWRTKRCHDCGAHMERSGSGE